jgi:CHAT domain-containing protein
LLEDYALALVPHGPFLLDQLTASPFGADSPQGILLLGNVAFDDKVESSPALARVTERAPVMGEGRPHWSDLAWTDREIRQVKELARGQTVYQLTGGKATAPNLLADLPRVRQAHVATHGFFADPKFRSRLQLAESFFWRDSVVDGETVERIGVGARNPLLLSGLVLAGANRPETPGRGILTADAIAGLNLTGLNLVVLSACETGLGEVAGGEGVYSLQRAFHMAGTRNVMASLWRVGDEATAALMIQFYRNLWQEKLPPLAALRRAQLALYRHPELITSWARGERGPDLGSSRPRSDKEAKSSIGSLAIEHSPVKSWAGFILSGLGH